MQHVQVKPYIKLIESICLRRFNYTEEGHECYVYVLDKIMEKNYAVINAFQGRSTFKTYLVSITNRLAIDFYRHRYGRTSTKSNPEQPSPKKNRLKTVSAIDLENLSDEGHLDETVIQREDQEAKKRLVGIVKAQLSELSPEDRLLLKMKYEDNFKISEIAEILKLDQKKTYRKINKILSDLKEEFLKKGLNINRILETLHM
jgi:RNA polymerase sigma factor (sigma-70 family)